MKDDFEKNFQTEESYYTNYGNEPQNTEDSLKNSTAPSDDKVSRQKNSTDGIDEISEELHRTELASLILGILSFVLLGCCGVSIVLGVISLCFAYKTKNMTKDKKFSSMALAGLICSWISIALFVLSLIIFIFAFIMGSIYISIF